MVHQATDRFNSALSAKYRLIPVKEIWSSKSQSSMFNTNERPRLPGPSLDIDGWEYLKHRNHALLRSKIMTIPIARAVKTIIAKGKKLAIGDLFFFSGCS